MHARPGVATGLVYQATMWVVLALLLAVVRWGEGQPVVSIGLKAPRWRSVALGIGVAVGLIGLFKLVVPALIAMGTVDFTAGFATAMAWPVWLRAIAVVTGGIIEEVLYRGYALTRLAAITGSYWVAGALSIALFAVIHLPFWGPGILATVLAGSVVVTVVFVWTKDLLLVIIVHVLTDAVGLIVDPLVAAA